MRRPSSRAQRHLFKSVLAFLARASAERPMVMLLDDIHWADEPSLGLFEHIAPRLPELPLLMIGTYMSVRVRYRQAVRALEGDARAAASE